MSAVQVPTVKAQVSLGAAAAAFVVALVTGWYGGWQWAPVTFYAALIYTAVWRSVALLAYIAGAVTPEGDDDDEQHG